jgi:integrase
VLVFISGQLTEHRAPKTVENGKRVMSHFCKDHGDILLPRLRAKHGVDFLEKQRAKRIGAATQNMDLKAAFELARRKDFLKINPFRKIPLTSQARKSVVIMEKHDFAGFAELVEDKTLRYFFEFAVQSGMRRDEIRNL